MTENQPQEKQAMTQDEIATMITNALRNHDEAKKVKVDADLAELQEMMDQIDLYAPMVEAYGPQFIKKCGPMARTLISASFKEILPAVLPVVRQEARIVAQELCREFFHQLRATLKDPEFGPRPFSSDSPVA
jgi:hypothetical protein